MKKYFCFHCQKEVEPYSFWKWRFCPHCKRRITDNGEGFYMVCDKCGANLPPDAKRCLKCGHTLYGEKDIDVYAPRSFLFDNDWLNLLAAAVFLLLFIIIGLGVLYVSFYMIFFFIIVGAIAVLLNLFRMRF
jgi:ribosomal protein S26